jgi:hypothetical protein
LSQRCHSVVTVLLQCCYSVVTVLLSPHLPPRTVCVACAVPPGPCLSAVCCRRSRLPGPGTKPYRITLSCTFTNIMPAIC